MKDAQVPDSRLLEREADYPGVVSLWLESGTVSCVIPNQL
jgi:hypothetical protein